MGRSMGKEQETRAGNGGRSRDRVPVWLPAALAFSSLLWGGVAQGAGAQELRGDGTPGYQQAPLDPGAPYVVIRLAENRLMLMDGAAVLWTAPVATGTGFQLEGGRERWDFQTPRGVFRVERKEKDPVWIMPDWAFVERGQPVPPPDSPVRRQEGMLGSTAIYIGYELAIHGTDRPELVLDPDPDNRRVSHGCIRMTDEDARRLFHHVDVGTLVLIY